MRALSRVLLVVVVGLCSLVPGAAPAQNYVLQGYAWDTSVSPGQSLPFSVSDMSGANPGGIIVPYSVYRAGSQDSTPLATGNLLAASLAVPDPHGAAQNGTGWPMSFALSIPANWSSGFYFARFGVGIGATDIYFVVRPSQPGLVARTLYIVPFATAEAYNNWGGKSLYDFNSDVARAPTVSFDRPMPASGFYEGSSGWHRAFIKWLELNNIPAEFASDIDLHRNGGLLGPYQLAVIVGHAEYWSRSMRDNLDAFVYAGGNVAIFGGNTAWWQVRFEPNAAGVPNRKMVCYKYLSGEEGLSADPVTDRSLTTIHWFDSAINYPENRTIGLTHRSGAEWADNAPGPRPSTPYKAIQASHWVFQDTNLANGSPFGGDVVGYETDALSCLGCDGASPVPDGGDGSPHNFQILAVADARSWPSPPEKPGWAVLGLFEYNGTVFNAGTTDWTEGLVPELQTPASITQVGTITRNVILRLSQPRSPLQVATWSVHSYHAVNASDGGWRFYYAPDPFVGSGWEYDGFAFYGLRTQQAGSTPVYQYHATQSDGLRFHYSRDPNVGLGWVRDGVAFYAYPSSSANNVPVYQYHAVSGDGYRFMYSIDPAVGAGWIADGIAFYAPASN